MKKIRCLLGRVALTSMLATAAVGAGNAIDTLILGDEASENAHAFAETGSMVCRDELLLSGPGDIWKQEDVLVFRSQPLAGDGWIQARVVSTGASGDWTKIGVMMRESADANAKNVFMFDSSGHGLHAQWRGDTGGGTGQSDEVKLPSPRPYWVRAERAGDHFTLSASADGKTWTTVITRTIAMRGEILMGLVNSAGSKDRINHAIFDQISSSNSAGAWKDETIGKTDLTGSSRLNGLGEPSRRLLPKHPADYYGGEMSFQVKVDPVKQNYLTAKLWGSDGSDRMGRIILNVEGKEVGMRHGGGLDIFIHNVGAVSPGAFWYRTTILPKWLTEGRTSVNIKLRSAGNLYAYGQPWKYETYQQQLTSPTRGIYRIYSHVDPMISPGGEVQGRAPDYATAPIRPAVDEAAYFTKYKEEKNAWLKGLMNKAAPDQKDAAALAEAFQIPWTIAFRKREVAASVLRALDATCLKFNADPKSAAAEWGGNFAPAGYAISVMIPALTVAISERADLGNGPSIRRDLYAAMLRASVDAGRFNRQTITNQAIINAFNIYRANRGLLALKSKLALTEDEAKRYYKEACGIEKWRGSDIAPGGDKQKTATDIWMMTPKGGSREWNWCCANCYGRMDPYVYEMYRISGDPAFRDRAIQIANAHNFMVYPSVDENGYRAMLNEGVICTRNVYQPGHAYYGYLNIAASMADRKVFGAVAQGLADRQLLESWQPSESSLRLPEEYERIGKGIAATGPLPVLPATPGQPDFAWADEQNAVLSIKHGADHHFLTFARRSEAGLHRIGDAHSLTPDFERVVQFALDDVRYEDTGEFFTVGPAVQSDFTGTPPDKPVNAYAGQKWPKLKGRPGSPADFYGVRYGDFWIGMNCSEKKNFTFAPEGFKSGVDMISGKTMTAPVQVPPNSTVVFAAGSN